MCEAEIAYDTDHDLYVSLGSSVQAVIDRVEDALNVMNLQFEGELSSTHRVTHIEVRTTQDGTYDYCPAGDPDGCCDPFGCLTVQMSGEWNTNPLFAIPRDIVHLFVGQGTGLPGVGRIASLCVFNPFSWSQMGGGPLGCVETTRQTHEVSHVWGAGHCDGLGGCSSTTMPCASGCATAFHSCSNEELRCARDRLSCLSPAQLASIRVEAGGVVIENGDPFDFGTTLTTEAKQQAFDVFNDGTTDLTLGVFQLPLGYALIAGPPSTIPPAGSDGFTAELGAGSGGDFVGALSFPTNDPNDDPFTIQLSGIVVDPDSLDPVWLDFGHQGVQRGTELEPFQDLALAIGALAPGGTMRIQAGTSLETPTLSKPMTVVAEGGVVRIGG